MVIPVLLTHFLRLRDGNGNIIVYVLMSAPKHLIIKDSNLKPMVIEELQKFNVIPGLILFFFSFFF